MNDLDALLKKLDPDVVKKLSGIAGSDAGKKLASRFSSLGKDDLIRQVSAMSREEKDALVSSVIKDPALVQKLQNFGRR